MDDDFDGIHTRYVENGMLKSAKVSSLDDLFEGMIELYEHEKVRSLSLAVQGDYIGGTESRGVKQGVMRTCVGGFFLLCTDRRIDWLSSMNEDIATSLVYGQRGDLFLRLGVAMASSKPIG